MFLKPKLFSAADKQRKIRLLLAHMTGMMENDTAEPDLRLRSVRELESEVFDKDSENNLQRRPYQ